MRTIYAPWRMQYVRSAPGDGCIFCDRHEDPAAVVARTPNVFTIVNAYPYTPGHVMISPLRHVARFGELSLGERNDLFAEARRTVAALRALYAPERIHVGANIGRSAGAGVVGHLHLHVVPLATRWRLDDPAHVPLTTAIEAVAETARRVHAALAGRTEGDRS